MEVELLVEFVVELLGETAPVGEQGADLLDGEAGGIGGLCDVLQGAVDHRRVVLGQGWERGTGEIEVGAGFFGVAVLEVKGGGVELAYRLGRGAGAAAGELRAIFVGELVGRLGLGGWRGIAVARREGEDRGEGESWRQGKHPKDQGGLQAFSVGKAPKQPFQL